MLPIAEMRRWVPWLVGLYLVAQFCGVVPLISCHSAHAVTGASTLSQCRGGIGALHPGHHHAGDADDVANHHVLQDLNGVLAPPPDRDEIAFVHVVIAAPAPHALTDADPGPLEHPPKQHLSI
jgi:hypothetical protein